MEKKIEAQSKLLGRNINMLGDVRPSKDDIYQTNDDMADIWGVFIHWSSIKKNTTRFFETAQSKKSPSITLSKFELILPSKL